MSRTINRRGFLKGTLASAALLVAGANFARANKSGQKRAANSEWFMPDEGERHSRTWMAFGASARIWGDDLLPLVQRNLATLARTIAQY